MVWLLIGIFLFGSLLSEPAYGEKGMTQNEAGIFQERLEVIIKIYRNQGDVLNIEIIGVLEIVKLNLWQESGEDDTEP